MEDRCIHGSHVTSGCCPTSGHHLHVVGKSYAGGICASCMCSLQLSLADILVSYVGARLLATQIHQKKLIISKGDELSTSWQWQK